jgi:hypothetical protein
MSVSTSLGELIATYLHNEIEISPLIGHSWYILFLTRCYIQTGLGMHCPHAPMHVYRPHDGVHHTRVNTWYSYPHVTARHGQGKMLRITVDYIAWRYVLHHWTLRITPLFVTYYVIGLPVTWWYVKPRDYVGSKICYPGVEWWKYRNRNYNLCC